jgi:hypothetical protein
VYRFYQKIADVAAHNTMVLFRATTGNQKLDHLNFRLELVKGLRKTHESTVPWSVYGYPSTETPPKNLRERHFLEKIPASGKMPKRSSSMLFVPDKRVQKEPTYLCPGSQAGLRLVESSKIYRMKLHF